MSEIKWKEKAKRRDRIIKTKELRIQFLSDCLLKAEKCLTNLCNHSNNIDDDEYEMISETIEYIKRDTRIGK